MIVRTGKLVFAVLVLAVNSPSTALGEISSSESAALSFIFGEDVLQRNLTAVRSEAAKLSADERFRFLTDWVLPGDNHSNFRLAMDFSSAQNAGNFKSSPTPDGIEDALRLRRRLTGGELISPAMDLVALATELGRLPSLRKRIEEIVAVDADAVRCRRTMLTLCDIADGDLEAVDADFAKLYAGLVAIDRKNLRPRCPETLAVYAGVRNPATREIAEELLSYLLDTFIRASRSASRDAWDHQLTALGGRIRTLYDQKSEVDSDRLPSTGDWHPVSRLTAQSRGAGYPSGAWKLNRGVVRNLSSHDEEYLYFRSPLRGDYQVECDVTLNGWQHAHLSVAGLWVAPAWGMSTFDSGVFRQHRLRGQIVPPMTATNDWIRPHR